MLDKAPREATARVRVLAEPGARDAVAGCDLERRLAALGFATSAVAVPRGGPPPADVPPASRQAGEMAAAIAPEVSAALAERGIPLLLGTDHAISLAGLQALSRCVDAFGLLWFDATASFAPPAEDGRHGPADMVLSRALGYDAAFPGLKPQLSPENVVLIGLREVMPREAEIIKESRVAVFTIADIDALGIREVMRQALRRALAGTRGIYVSYSPAVTDIPGMASGSGGLTLRETHQAMEIIAQTGAMLAMDAVGLNPGQDRRAIDETCNFVLSCFGKQIL